MCKHTFLSNFGTFLSNFLFSRKKKVHQDARQEFTIRLLLLKKLAGFVPLFCIKKNRKNNRNIPEILGLIIVLLQNLFLIVKNSQIEREKS